MSTPEINALLAQLAPDVRDKLRGNPNESNEAALRYLTALDPDNQWAVANIASVLGGTIGVDVTSPTKPACATSPDNEAAPESDAAQASEADEPNTGESLTKADDDGEVAEQHAGGGETLQDYPPHPVADLFPMMSTTELGALAADIEERGLDEPIVLFEGKVIDGRNRQAACTIAGVTPRFVEWDGEGSLVSYVLGRNLHRRHLTNQQRAVVAAKAKELLVEEAKGRRSENLKQNKAATDGLDPGHRSAGRSAAVAAETLKVSRDAVNKASKIIKDGDPELVAAVEHETVSLDAAATVATLPQAEQRRAVAEGKVKEAAKKLRAKKKSNRKAPPSGAASGLPAASLGSELPAEAEAERSTTASPPTQKPATPPPVVTPKQAFTVALRVVHKRGPDFARKLINRIASDMDLEVWIASNDPEDDLSHLASLLRHRVEAMAASDFEQAEGWIRTHVDDFHEILQTAAPDETEVEDDCE